MATYVNNLRLTELATGEGSGTWGATTNTNLELIGQALGFGTRAIANASTDNITIADGASDSDAQYGEQGLVDGECYFLHSYFYLRQRRECCGPGWRDKMYIH